MTGNVSITQPINLGISIFDRISTGTFFRFINPTGVQPTGLCVKISKDEIYDFTSRTKHSVTNDMKLMDIQVMAVNMVACPDCGPSLKKSYNEMNCNPTDEDDGEDCAK